jgi:hypothetical protein
MRSDRWLLRVFARGTLSRSAFSTPEAVALAWLDSQPQHPQLAAIKRWRLPAFDHRDRRLHQLLVTAYTVDGRRKLSDRRGIFVTAFRSNSHGGWRLLEATVEP